MQKPCIWESLGPWELIHSEVHGGLQYKNGANAFQFRPEINLNILELSRTFQCENTLIDFGGREIVACMQRQRSREFLDVDIGTAG